MKKEIKNITKKALLVAVMLTAMLSFANETSALPTENSVKTTALKLEDVKEGNLLSIKDRYGIIIYKEIIETSGNYSKGFDLTALPNGYYFFELDKDVEINTIPFIVKNTEVIFNKKEETRYFKPIVRIKDNRVLVSKLALDENPLKIDLYYLESGDSQLIYTELIENTKVIERIYKLDKHEKGAYKVVCKSEGRATTSYLNN